MCDANTIVKRIGFMSVPRPIYMLSNINLTLQQNWPVFDDDCSQLMSYLDMSNNDNFKKVLSSPESKIGTRVGNHSVQGHIFFYRTLSHFFVKGMS